MKTHDLTDRILGATGLTLAGLLALLVLASVQLFVAITVFILFSIIGLSIYVVKSKLDFKRSTTQTDVYDDLDPHQNGVHAIFHQGDVIPPEAID